LQPEFLYWRDGHPLLKLRLMNVLAKCSKQYWRDGRVVECGGHENRYPPTDGPAIRIPLTPQRQITPVRQLADGIFKIVFF
jgi:nitrite reductase/ring-hydroxylating ferredoxin subunit